MEERCVAQECVLGCQVPWGRPFLGMMIELSVLGFDAGPSADVHTGDSQQPLQAQLDPDRSSITKGQCLYVRNILTHSLPRQTKYVVFTHSVLV